MKNYIPINKVKNRIENLDLFLMKKNKNLSMYPLDETYNEIYDFANLKSSILNWNYFSESVYNNINQICFLLKIIKENGTKQELQEASNIINTEIIPYLKNPTEFKYIFNKLDNMPDIVNEINSCICEQAECDRVIYNKDLISKRFNINKIFSHILEEDNFIDTIYNFCDLIDTYDMPLKSKYCISNELALLSIKDYYEKLPVKLIEENIIDYYVINHGTNDIPKFIDTIQDAINKDKFISEHATEYLKYIEKIYNNMDGRDYEKEVLEHFNENIGIKFVINYSDNNDNLKNAYTNILKEMTLFDKSKNYVKDLLTKIKIAPVRTIGMLKNLLQSAFNKIGKDNIDKAITIVLKLSSLTLITMSFFTPTFISIALNHISDMILKKCGEDPFYIRKSIQTMTKYKNKIYKKLQSETSVSKKERLQKYKDSLENEIKKLENKYSELQKKNNETYGTPISKKINAVRITKKT